MTPDLATALELGALWLVAGWAIHTALTLGRRERARRSRRAIWVRR